MVRKIEDGRWFVCARIRKNGKIIQRKRIITGTREQAKRLFEEFKREIREDTGSSLKIAEISTFDEAMKIYREKKQVSVSHLRKINFLSKALGSVSFIEFPDKFEQWLKLYRMSLSSKTGKIPGNHAVNRFIEIVRAVFNLLRELKLYNAENPITKARFPKLKEIPRDVILCGEEIRSLLNIINREAPHLSAIIRFALQVPCRKSELVNMRKEDLDLFNNVIRVRNGTTKNDQGCFKPMPPDMVEYFRSLPKETEYLFYRRGLNGEYLSLGDFKRAFRRCLRIAGIKDFKFHDTRHVAATNLIDNGTPEQVVMSVANWKTNMLRVYYNRSPKKTFELIRFSRQCEPKCEPLQAVNS